MRVLLVHNYYRRGNPGGEDFVFEQERELLREAGHVVACYTRSNDEISEERWSDRIRVVSGMQRSGRTLRELSALIADFRPDVAHFHNTFPLISLSAYLACRGGGVPIVQTLHNYRYSCAAATHFREGAPCEACSPLNPSPAVINRCYRSSFLGSTAIALTMLRNDISGVFRSSVARFIVMTEFASRRLERFGIAADQIFIKPNFVDFNAVVEQGRQPFCLFAGRLSDEKGLWILLDAWRNLSDIPLKVVGEGPLGPALKEFCRNEGLSVEFLGMQSRSDVGRLMQQARALIFPSLWFECMPLTVLEAWAAGAPVIASDLGAMSEMIKHGENGMLFRAGDSKDLVEKVRSLANDPGLAESISKSARAGVQVRHSKALNLSLLEDVYRQAIARAVI
jgi:glycosyltransferase involved in cell wall biosynthesis